MKLMIMLLISLLLATGVEASKKKCTKCTKKFEKAERKFNQCKTKSCPSPSPSSPPAAPPLAPPSKQPGSTFTTKDSLKKAVKAFNKKPAKAEKEYGPIAGWDDSGITDMSGLFIGFKEFNADISSWDASGVTDMRSMFSDLKNFNADLSNWDTSGVTNMSGMFYVRCGPPPGTTTRTLLEHSSHFPALPYQPQAFLSPVPHLAR